MNPNLGLFDMTLALSTSKINSQFAFLHRKGIIKKDWKFLCNVDGDKTMVGTDPDFEKALKAWKDSQDKKLENEFSSLSDQVDAELEKDEPDMAKITDWQSRKKELKTLIADKQKYAIYDCALECQINPPKVWLIQGESNKLYFEVPIKTGTLSYKKEGSIKSDNIDNSKYVFAVPIANKIVKKADVILGDTEKDKLVVNGLSDDIFRIESLFLDFQNANVAQYDAVRSVITTNGTQMQIAMTNYFGKIVNHADNPYILGYSVQAKTITPDALLQPTVATYSTSFSTEERSSAFNFLMQVDYHELPKDQRRGVLPYSLIEKALDKSATVNGVMGINFKTFVEQYVDRILTPLITDKFEEALRSTYSSGYKVIRGTSNKANYRVEKPDPWMEITLVNRRIYETPLGGQSGINGIAISWDIDVYGNAHKEVEKKIVGITVGTIGMDQGFSTQGAHSINGQASRRGKIIVSLSASTEGKLSVTQSIEKPVIGKNTEAPTYTDPDDAVLDTLLTVLQAIILDIEDLIDTISGNAFNIDLSATQLLNNLRIEDLGGISNRVILPGSNVFAFQNLRLLTRSEDELDAVLFDIAYAPETI